MQITCYLIMAVQKGNMGYMRVDQPHMAPQTKTSIMNYIQHQTDYWMLLADPWLSEVFKLNKIEWNEEQSTCIITIDIHKNAIGKDFLPPYPALSQESAALSVLNKFLYNTWMNKIADFYYYYLKKYHLRKTAFFPIINQIFMSIKH